MFLCMSFGEQMNAFLLNEHPGIGWQGHGALDAEKSFSKVAVPIYTTTYEDILANWVFLSFRFLHLVAWGGIFHKFKMPPQAFCQPARVAVSGERL